MLVVKGGAGLRLVVRTLSEVTVAVSAPQRLDVGLGRGLVGDGDLVLLDLATLGHAGAVDRDQRGLVALAGGRLEQGLQGPVLARREGLDGPFALDHQAHRDRLHAAGGEAAAHLAADERAQRVAHEAVHDAARLLGVDEAHVDVTRRRRRPR